MLKEWTSPSIYPYQLERYVDAKANTSGVDLQTMWAHFLMPIDVIVSG